MRCLWPETSGLKVKRGHMGTDVFFSHTMIPLEQFQSTEPHPTALPSFQRKKRTNLMQNNEGTSNLGPKV